MEEEVAGKSQEVESLVTMSAQLSDPEADSWASQITSKYQQLRMNMKVRHELNLKLPNKNCTHH